MLNVRIKVFLLAVSMLTLQKADAEPGLPACYTLPSCCVEGVNLLNGNYCNHVIDVATEGVDPIILGRYHTSRDPEAGWHYNVTKHLYLSKGDDGTCIVNYPDGQGGVVRFSSRDAVEYPLKFGHYYCPKSATFFYNPQDPANASHPCYTGSASGQHHLDNVRIQTSNFGATLTAYHGDGTIRYFKQLQEKTTTVLPLVYELEKEILPSGNQRLMWCSKKEKEKGKEKSTHSGTVKLETRSSKGTLINHLLLERLHHKASSALTNDNKKVSYRQRKRQHIELDNILGNHYFKEVCLPNGLIEHYAYDKLKRLMRKELPDDRVFSVHYLGDEGIVSELEQPLPNEVTTGLYQTSHSFSYPKRSDGLHECQVLSPERGYVSIVSDKGKLLEYTRYVSRELHQNKPLSYPSSIQKFFWGNREKREDLVTIACCLSNNHPKSALRTIGCRTFAYDTRHNVTEERLYGNLSGTCKCVATVDAKGNVAGNGADSTWTRYRYSEDGRNLLLATEEESGKITTYTYKEGTNLLTAELVGDGTQQIHRTFHVYNDQGARIATLIDDGVNTDCNDLTGVTTWRATRTQPKVEGVAIGAPLIQEEFCLNAQGRPQLLQKSTYAYDAQGRVTEEVLYDACGAEKKRTLFTYDAVGWLISTHSLDGQMEYVYDANGNRIEEHFVSLGVTHYNTYDRLNHLIERREVASHAEERLWRYRYNSQGQCVEEIDPFENKTVHRFDALGREVETEYPATISSKGELVPCITQHKYDACDMKIESQNGAGYSEKMTYNMRGQITKHTFPDGSFDTKEYTPWGALKRTVSRLGLVTEYDSDVLSRACAKRDYDKEGNLLSCVRYVYKGLLLQSVIHEGGMRLDYTYDYAGRLIEQRRNQELEVSYTYNASGKLHTKKEWIDATNAKVTTYTYDAQDHIIDETVSDMQGNVLSREGHTYDLQGNCIETRQYLSDGVALTQTRYDAWKRVIEVIDPEGHKTHFTYDTETNALGQKVQKITRCDAKGHLHITLYHANGQIYEERDIDSLGILLRSHKLFYNARNQVTERLDSVYMQGEHLKDIVTQWIYNEAGYVATLLEAVGTPEERQTHTLYTADGQVQHVQLPSGETQEFTYNVKGEKIGHADARGTFSFHYTYDNMGHLIEAADHITGNVTKRQFDLRDRLLQEELGNSLTITYQHDLLGRTKHIGLPDGSAVAYEHDPVYLRGVLRLDRDGQERYAHRYKEIDPSGATLQAELALSCGDLHMTYTKRGKLQSIEHAKWSEHIPHYDPLGNLMSRTTHDPSGMHTVRYAYDALNQLIQETGHVKGYADHLYAYDSLYNRQVQDGLSGQFNHLNQLLERGSTTYRYDKNGQTIAIENGITRTEYTYDGLGRLTALQSGNSRVTYLYDPFHRRLSKTLWTRNIGCDEAPWCEGETERFLYLDQNEVGSIDQANHMHTFRVLGRGVGAEIGASVALEIDDTPYVPLHDQSGSIAALLDSDGNVVEYARYSAYGECTLFDAYTKLLEQTALGNPWGYASKRLDTESGWNFFGRRYYNPQEGRWMTPDPLGFTEGPNLYAYVQNRPLTHFDLYGLSTKAALMDWPTLASIQNIAGKVFRDFKPILQMPGKLIETIARHFLPMPGFRDAFMGIGRTLSGRPFWGCELCREHNAFNYTIPGQNVEGVGITFTNGICTSPRQAIEAAGKFSASHGNNTVYLTYNPTRGLTLDLLRSLYMMAGGTIESSYKLVENWQKVLEEMKTQNGKLPTIVHYAHSQGGQVTWGAAKLAIAQGKESMLDNIEVTTFGSAHLIPDGTFKTARNFVSDRDIVPSIASPIRYKQAREGKGSISNVWFYNSRGTHFCDHTMDCYKALIRREGDSFQNRKDFQVEVI